ncbi:MAG: hypothetical protein K2Q27_00235 [Novosphingobium sp.]|jgi:hypothetical protein|uniref:hypothetical protein n=1 Tax=Novosphingobium sp. NDB2Meth1 TaxID=1892847 RepID=UPI000931AB38|nr:hypothetical protein [Novosphingobium sp. NDB2Meth1]MBY0391670.1 hypothetical protein [Novosphingobium sp.]
MAILSSLAASGSVHLEDCCILLVLAACSHRMSGTGRIIYDTVRQFLAVQRHQNLPRFTNFPVSNK